ncbi:MAG: ComF family protein [Chloroflexi bacterium]|nr:ComF family protein [Chloroflexota bacterium]
MPQETPVTSRPSRWLTRLSAAGQTLLDLIYPPRCAGCGRVGDLFCAGCQAQVEPITPPVCRRCGRSLGAGDLCPACRGIPSPLDGIASAAIFGGPLREAIHRFKYGNGYRLAPVLGGRMAEAWPRHGLAADLIVPVPLHAGRLAERGYNQSALLAREVGRAVGIPVNEAILVRHKATQQQAMLNRVERQENVKDAFACRGQVTGKRIVLVDDVCTTGSTLEACAAVLKAGGAASAWALTLARTRWDPHAPAPDAV